MPEQRSPGSGSRWELIRALGAIADSPEAARSVGPALDLSPVSAAEHTDVFVLNLPPYAAPYLSVEATLGGEAADRVAGFWRAMGLDPPAEPDHLSTLLGLYATLGEAVDDSRAPAVRKALTRALATLRAEHLCSWLPPYLDAVRLLPVTALHRWADLVDRFLYEEATSSPATPGLPLALRTAPSGGPPELAGPKDLADWATSPLCSGIVLTKHALATGAQRTGVGLRAGERRYALRFMFEQDPAATADWLATEAQQWVERHRARPLHDETTDWWAANASYTVAAMRRLARGQALVDAAGS